MDEIPYFASLVPRPWISGCSNFLVLGGVGKVGVLDDEQLNSSINILQPDASAHDYVRILRQS